MDNLTYKCVKMKIFNTLYPSRHITARNKFPKCKYIAKYLSRPKTSPSDLDIRYLDKKNEVFDRVSCP